MEEPIVQCFWECLQPAARFAFYQKHPLTTVVPDESLFYSLRYALCALGFHVHAAQRSITVSDAEIASLRDKMTREKFEGKTVDFVCGELRDTLEAL